MFRGSFPCWCSVLPHEGSSDCSVWATGVPWDRSVQPNTDGLKTFIEVMFQWGKTGSKQNKDMHRAEGRIFMGVE